MIKMNRAKFEAYMARGKGISVHGEKLIVMENGDLEPVKITGQVNYKGTKPNSFTPVLISLFPLPCTLRIWPCSFLSF